mmetsp:Transcript_28606/g.68184  ORF Transcript_28606/g.68184 Transcript_28606/m.68184 type:complete len:247 (-) Transcript_28606:787-1527(-)
MLSASSLVRKPTSVGMLSSSLMCRDILSRLVRFPMLPGIPFSLFEFSDSHWRETIAPISSGTDSMSLECRDSLETFVRDSQIRGLRARILLEWRSRRERLVRAPRPSGTSSSRLSLRSSQLSFVRQQISRGSSLSWLKLSHSFSSCRSTPNCGGRLAIRLFCSHSQRSSERPPNSGGRLSREFWASHSFRSDASLQNPGGSSRMKHCWRFLQGLRERGERLRGPPNPPAARVGSGLLGLSPAFRWH